MATLLVALAATIPAAAAEAAPDAPPGELIVRFVPGAEAADRADLRDAANVRLEARLPVPGLQLVEAESGQSTAAAARELARASQVAYVEPNYYRREYVEPNDSYFGLQWALENTGQSGGLPGADIHAPAAWDLTTGTPDTIVAVVDTGVSTAHPDLSGTSWINPNESGSGRESNGIDDDGNGYVDDWRGWDWVAADGDPADENGHGTHVSGTLAARANNSRGVAGVSWNARLMPLRVLGADGTGTVADVVRAYRYAAANGARIVNASLGSASFSRAEQDAIAGAPGVLFVVAAGNGSEDHIGDDNDSTPDYPCSYALANIVCVAATGRSDSLAGFSNYGAESVDLAAPGERILSTWMGGTYAYASGTSMATPHVAGTAALIAAARPTLGVGELRAALLGGVDRLPSLTGRVATGGRLDALRALQLAAPPMAAPAPTAPSQPPIPAPQPGPPSADRQPPRISLRTRRRQRLARVLARGLPVRVACTEPCRLRVSIVLDPRTARRARHRRRTQRLTLGARTTPPAMTRRMIVRLSRRARSRLPRRGAVRITIQARANDLAGNARTARRRAVLTR